MRGASSKFQTLAAVTVVATLALIAIGAVVRTTGSGLGCPDWPLCHGGWHPPLEKTAVIEYSHRTAAAIVGVLVVTTASVALLRYRGDRLLRWLAIASLPLLAWQAWLGKLTVERELPPELVTFHLATALVLLAILTVIAVLARMGPSRRPVRTPDRERALRIVLAGALVTYLVLLSGSYVVGSGATTACDGWPGCPAAPAPFLDGIREQHIHWLHRIAVLGGLAATVAAGIAVTKLRDNGRLRTVGWLLIALYGAQILVGAANIWSDYSEAVRVAHLALGSTIWALLVLLATAARYRPAEATARAHAPSAGPADARSRTAARA